MYIDLNIEWTGLADATERCISAAQLGYSGVAFNVYVDLNEVDANKSHECPFPTQDLIVLVNNIQSKIGRRFHVKNVFSEMCLPSLKHIDYGTAAECPFVVLRRITLLANHPNQIKTAIDFVQKHIDTYDVTAIQPTDEKSWLAAIKEPSFDILALRLEKPQLDFPLRRPQLKQATTASYIELCIGPMLRDCASRKHFFTNINPIVQHSNHDNIIITSGCKDIMGLRSPLDLCNLADVLGVKLPRRVIGEAALGVLYRGASRRSGGGMVSSMAVAVNPLSENETKIHNDLLANIDKKD